MAKKDKTVSCTVRMDANPADARKAFADAGFPMMGEDEPGYRLEVMGVHPFGTGIGLDAKALSVAVNHNNNTVIITAL